MKRFVLAAALFGFAALGYIGSPFVTAWNIREAVRNGNSDYLASAIEWESVRETLKPSIAQIALNLPDPEVTSKADQGLWTRFKAYWGQGMVDSLVNTYVTPQGLPQLFSLKQTYRNYVGGEDDPANKLAIGERIARAWARVKRAEFTGFSSFEIDMEDKYDASRMYFGKLELGRTGWKLTSLRVKFLTTAKSAVQKLTSID
jgi:hypothetical protein